MRVLLSNRPCQLLRLLVAVATMGAPHVLARAAEPSFSIRVDLLVAADAAKGQAARLVLVAGAGPPAVALEITPTRLRLSQGTEGKAPRVAEAAVRLAPGRHWLLLRQGPRALTVCVDARQALEAPVRLAAVPKVGFEAAEGLSLEGRPRVQRLGPVHFADDFARDPREGTRWQTLSGRFAINGSRNPGSSQSAFQLWAGAPDGRGLAVAESSHWFWHDYRAGVSAQCVGLPASWGLVVHYVDPDNYHALRWTQPADGPGVAQLLRRRGGRDTVLAERPLAMRPHQWYRATVVTRGTAVRAYIGGTEVARADDPALTGGRVGLLVERTASVYFDDAAVASVDGARDPAPGQLDRPFGPSEQPWSDYAKKSFFTDPYMVQWAHPRCFWQSVRQGATRLSWFRTRVFHDAALAWSRGDAPCHWPAKPVRVVLFGDGERAGSGYTLLLAGRRAVLSREGAAVVEGKLDAASLTSLRVSAAAGEVRCQVNGRQVLRWRDPSPLRQGFVAADLGPTRGMYLKSPDWRDTARVESTHRLDYSFDHAPAAWAVHSGRWRSTHRWACVPHWSFFSGRGLPAADGVAHGNALLWNLRRFAGDFDLELFLAPPEGTPQRVHFTWPVTLNVAFAADGRRLDSGYMLLFGTYDLPTRLFRAGREVASWAGRVDRGLRRRHSPWYNRVTRVWQHLRIQRRGRRILIDVARHDDRANYLGLERAFDLDDPEPLTGDRIGLWTWGANGLAVARATISYAASPGVVAMGDLPGARGTADVAVAQMAEHIRGGKRFHRIRNLGSGGTFAHDLARTPIDLDATGTLELEHRLSPGLALSLMASVRGHTAELVLCGPDRYRPTTIPLGRLVPGTHAAPGCWHQAAFDFRGALREVFPTGPLVLDRLTIASPCESVAELAGLGVNREGAWYDLGRVAWRPSPPVEPPPQPPRLRVLVHGIDPLDDFERDLGDWQRLGGWDGAALYRDRHEPASGRFALRLLNQEIAGPAGAWVTRRPYDLSAFPRLAFAYRMPPGVEMDLVVEANGQRFEVRATGTDSTWPTVGLFDDFHADGAWHRAEFDLYAKLRRWLRTDRVEVTSLAFADSRRMSTHQGAAWWIDDFCRVPAIDPKRPAQFQLRLEPAAPIAAYSHLVDDKPHTAPPPKPTGEGDTLRLVGPPAGRVLHVRARTAAGQWTAARHLPIVAGKLCPPAPPESTPAAPTAGPPPAPFIAYLPSDRLCCHEFEWERSQEFPEAQLGELGIRRAAWVLRCAHDAATGRGCVELVNLGRRMFYSAYFRRSAWDPERWPRVAFDYKFEQPGCALNLSMLANEAMAIVEWTGPNRRGSAFADAVVGQAERAKQDGQWHHVEIDLLAMLVAKRFGDPAARGAISVAELATWATSHKAAGYTNRHGARLKIDNFAIYSPRGRSPAFAWRVHAPAARVKGYTWAFDQRPDTVPPAEPLSDKQRAQFTDVAPGTWYFHVRACSPDGRWGATAHHRIEIAR